MRETDFQPLIRVLLKRLGAHRKPVVITPREMHDMLRGDIVTMHMEDPARFEISVRPPLVEIEGEFRVVR